jgi:glycosyltransferase involved in cell wall biosynthesis
MRIAIANNYYYLRGGAERVLLEEKKILEAHGHQVCVFAQAHPRNEPSPYSAYFPPFKDWRATRGLAKAAMAMNILYDRRAARCFLRFLEAAQPDIVHAHNIYGGLTTSILDVAREKRIPVVMTLHDYKLICPSYLMLKRGAVCEDCKAGRFIYCLLNRCHKESLTASGVYCAESYLNRWLHKYDTVRYFICPSMFSLRKHAEHGIPPDRLLGIPNFAGAAARKPRWQGGRYALFVGRLSAEKGIATLLAAARGLDVPVRLVGDGPLMAELQDFVKHNGMTHVAFEGYKSGADLQRLYEDAAFLVLPSQCYENAPMSILEAYACGKPVVGSRIGGIAEMVEQGRTGLQFTPGNAGELADCMRTLWLDEPLRAQMGLAARDKVEREYCAEVHYEQLMQLYRHVLSQSTNRTTPLQLKENHENSIFGREEHSAGRRHRKVHSGAGVSPGTKGP